MAIEEKPVSSATPTPNDLEVERLQDGLRVLVNAVLPDGATDAAFYRMERAAVRYVAALWDVGADGFAGRQGVLGEGQDVHGIGPRPAWSPGRERITEWLA
jgi:hypothetical protein